VKNKTIATITNLKKPILIFSIILIAILFTIPIYAPRFVLQMLLTIILYINLVIAWNIFSGFTGYLFLGVAAIYGIAGYAYALISPNVPYLLAVFLVGIISFIIAYIIGIIFLRIRGPYFTIASYALVLLFSSVIVYYEQAFSHRTGRTVTIVPLSNIYIVLLAVTVITLIAAIIIRNSKFGYGLFYIKGNEDLANVIGINVSFYKCLSFSISAFFIGMSAAVIIPRGGYIDTTVVFASIISFNVLVMGVIGGIGSIRGGITSALLLSLFYDQFASRQNPYPFFIGLSVLLILGIFFFPKGIEGVIERIESLRVKGKVYQSIK
jgi:branched-chain amino acid transport system permease protein